MKHKKGSLVKILRLDRKFLRKFFYLFIMELLLLLLGLSILILNFFDFFHTILSGRGFGIISKNLNKLQGKLILKAKNKMLFEYSGLIHMMVTSLTWLILLIGGCFLIFSSGEMMVVDSQTKLPATLIERFYYTGYVISTLGIGDFVPGTDFSRILTSLLSFSGFVLLTTVLTYLLSVVSAVQQKRLLAFYISSLGEDINELYQSAIAPEEFNSLLENSSSLKEKILQNSSSSIFFPITQYYLTSKKDASLELQLVRLREVLTVLSYQFEEKSGESIQLKGLLAAIQKYLQLGTAEATNEEFYPEELNSKRKFWQQHGISFRAETEQDKILTAALKHAGWEWDEVYS